MEKIFKDFNLIKRFSFSFFIKVLGLFIGYVFVIYITKTFGPETLGIYSIIFSILNILSAFSRFSLDVVLTKVFSEYYFENKDKKNYIFLLRNIYIRSIFFVFFLSFFLSAIVYFLIPVVLSSLQKIFLEEYLYFVPFLLAPFSFYFINSNAIKGMGKVYEHMVVFHIGLNFMTLVVIFICNVFFPVVDKNLLVLYSFSFSVFFLSLLSFYFYKDLFFKFNAINNIVKEKILSFPYIIKMASNLFISNISTIIMDWSIILIIAFFCTERDVGIFNILLKFAVFISLPLVLINTIVIAKIGKYWKESKKEQLYSIILNSSKIVTISSFLLFAILTIFSNPILEIFGKDFLNQKFTFYILCLGEFLNAFMGNVGIILIMINQHIFHRNTFIFAAIFKVLLAIFLVNEFGLLGAAFTHLFSILILKLILLYKVKLEVGIYPFQWIKITSKVLGG